MPVQVTGPERSGQWQRSRRGAGSDCAWLTDALASVSLSLVVLGGVIALDTYRTVRVRDDGVQSRASRARTTQ